MSTLDVSNSCSYLFFFRKSLFHNITLLLRLRLGNIPNMLIILMITLSHNSKCHEHIESALQNLLAPQGSHPKYVIMQFHILLLALLSTQCTPTCVCRDCWFIFHAWPKLFLILSSKSSIRIVHPFRCSIEKLVPRAILAVVWSFCLVLHSETLSY